LFDVGFFRGGLVGSSPEGPVHDLGWVDAPLRKPHGDATEFLNRPADQDATRRALIFLLGGGTWLA